MHKELNKMARFLRSHFHLYLSFVCLPFLLFSSFYVSVFAMIEHQVILTFWHYSTDEKRKRERKKSICAQIPFAKLQKKMMAVLLHTYTV